MISIKKIHQTEWKNCVFICTKRKGMRKRVNWITGSFTWTTSSSKYILHSNNMSKAPNTMNWTKMRVENEQKKTEIPLCCLVTLYTMRLPLATLVVYFLKISVRKLFAAMWFCSNQNENSLAKMTKRLFSKKKRRIFQLNPKIMRIHAHSVLRGVMSMRPTKRMKSHWQTWWNSNGIHNKNDKYKQCQHITSRRLIPFIISMNRSDW